MRGAPPLRAGRDAIPARTGSINRVLWPDGFGPLPCLSWEVWTRSGMDRPDQECRISSGTSHEHVYAVRSRRGSGVLTHRFELGLVYGVAAVAGHLPSRA
jgi:hypothetical protein